MSVEKPQPEQDADDTSLALRKQLEALAHAERLRQQTAQMAPQPVTREQRLALWKQQGLSEAEVHFLKEHPEMIDNPVLTNQAAGEAIQSGHEKNSPAYWEAVKMNFRNHLDRMQAQTNNPATKPTPEFFRPPPSPAPPTRSHIVSAPVSRDVVGSNREPDPKRVTLSTEEAEVARAAGISAVDYAKGKLRLQREKAAGERQ